MIFQEELFKDAIAIINGIPAKNINLATIMSDDKPDCGSVGCVAGWLASHPKFNELGLSLHAEDAVWLWCAGPPIRSIAFQGETKGTRYAYAMSKVFGIPRRDALRLFSDRKEAGLATDSKKEWLKRAHDYLEKHRAS